MLAGIAAGLVLACRTEETLPIDVVAQVGARAIHTSDLDTYLRRQVGQGAAGLDSIVLSRLLDRRIEEELLWLMARDRGWIGPDEGREDALTALAVEAEALEVSPEAVARVYADDPGSFRRPERTRLRHLMTREREAAEEARQRIASGEGFPAVARELSDAPSASWGGEQASLGPDELAPPFREAVLPLAPGEVSPVVATADGFHLFLVEGREEARPLTLEEAAPEIVDRLHRARAEALERSLVEEARGRYNVVVYRRNLPFQYQGRFP